MSDREHDLDREQDDRRYDDDRLEDRLDHDDDRIDDRPDRAPEEGQNDEVRSAAGGRRFTCIAGHPPWPLVSLRAHYTCHLLLQ